MMVHPYGDTQIDCPVCVTGTLIVSQMGVECRVCDYTTHGE